MRYENYAKAYVGELAGLLTYGHRAEAIVDPASPASKFGKSPRESIERFGTSFCIVDVSCPIVSPLAAPFDLQYGVGLLMWTFGGSTDYKWLEYYGGRPGPRRGASLGGRLFKNDGLNEAELAIQLLTNDPGSRRAYMPVFDMRDLLVPGLEIPCSAGFHLFARNGLLHSVAVMRAQNALEFLAADMFVFSYLSQYAADRLGLAVGSYTHMCTSFHVFEEDVSRARRIVSGKEEVEVYSLGEASGFSTELEELLLFEAHLRESAIRGNARELRALVDSAISSTRFENEICRNIAAVLLQTAVRRVGGTSEPKRFGLSNELSNLYLLGA